MKTVKLLALICIAILITDNTIAEPSDSVYSCAVPLELKKKLSNQIDFPKEAFELGIEGNVATCFYITPEGKLSVYCINGHPLLANYVKQKLEGIECCSPSVELVNKHMFVRFCFEIE